MVDFKKNTSFGINKRRKYLSESAPDFMDDIPVSRPVEKPEASQLSEKKNETDSAVTAIPVPTVQPKKRTVRKSIAIDEDTYMHLCNVKTFYRMDHQDIILVATKEFLEKYFPEGKASAEDVERIKQQISALNS